MKIIKYLFKILKHIVLKLQQTYQECSTNLFTNNNGILSNQEEKLPLTSTSNNQPIKKSVDITKNELNEPVDITKKELQELLDTTKKQLNHLVDITKNEVSTVNYNSHFTSQLRNRLLDTEDTQDNNLYREDEPLLKPVQVHKKFSFVKKPFFKRFDTVVKPPSHHLGCGDFIEDFETHPLLSRSNLRSGSDISVWSDEQDQKELEVKFSCLGCLSLVIVVSSQ